MERVVGTIGKRGFFPYSKVIKREGVIMGKVIDVSREARAWVAAGAPILVTIMLFLGWGALGEISHKLSGLEEVAKYSSIETALIQSVTGTTQIPWDRIFKTGIVEAHEKKYIELQGGKYLITASWKGKTRLLPKTKEDDIENFLKGIDTKGKPLQDIEATLLQNVGSTRWLREFEIPDLSPYGKIGVVAGYINEKAPDILQGFSSSGSKRFPE